MASSSNCFFLVSFTLLIVFASAQTSTTYIDAICNKVPNKPFCVQTLTTYPPAASATNTLQAVNATFSLVTSYAQKWSDFAKKAANENPILKNQITANADPFATVILNLKSGLDELEVDPMSANYDVMICTDSTKIVKNFVGKNQDKASKIIMMMTLNLEKLLPLAVGATEAVGG